MDIRDGFFLYMTVAMLVMVIVGFAPTLYVRPFFDVPPIPWPLYLHGIVMTGWFILLSVQPFLIRSGRKGLHKRLGVFTASYGTIVIVTGLLAPLGLVSRFVPPDVALDADISVLNPAFGIGTPIIEFAARAVWVNISLLVAFGLLLAAAVAFRKRAEVHKRLMLIASLAALGPALARIARWPVFGGEQGPFVPVVLLLFILLLLGYDLVTRKRPHAATILGVVVAVSTQLVAVRVASTGFGQALIRSVS